MPTRTRAATLLQPAAARSDSGGGGGETSGMAKLIPQLAEDHPAIAALAASGHAAIVEARIVNSQLPVPQLLAELADATAISAYNGIWLAPRAVPWPMPSPEALVAALPKLKCFQMTSAGYNALDVPGLASTGIVVANNGGANAVSVAEHTLTLHSGAGMGIAKNTFDCMGKRHAPPRRSRALRALWTCHTSRYIRLMSVSDSATSRVAVSRWWLVT